jgi:Nuclease-related domain
VNPVTLIICLAAFVPLIVLALAIFIEKRRQKHTKKPPQTEKLLRPPGYSLSIKFDEGADKMVFDLLKAVFLGAMSGACAILAYRLLVLHAPVLWLAICFPFLVLFIVACVKATHRTFDLFQEGRNIRLGMRGEQAVAEALNGASSVGFHSFHDLCDEKIGNIDHIAVGTRGIFLVETKARSRRASRNGQREHEVIYDGSFLQFPFFKTDEPIEQAKRNAKWLSNYLEKKTGESVWVEPLVVLPGWFVRISEKGDFPVKVMNANFLVGFLQRQNEKIESAQVRRIITALDEKCRDVEF